MTSQGCCSGFVMCRSLDVWLALSRVIEDQASTVGCMREQLDPVKQLL